VESVGSLPWLGYSALAPTATSSLPASFKASPVSANSGEPVAVGRVDASEPRVGLRQSRWVEGGRDFRRRSGGSGN
jgi:hypothetical protein